MAVKPEDLVKITRPEYVKAIQELEKLIDDHLYEHYSYQGCQMPGIEIDVPKEIVKNEIIEKYSSIG